MLKAQARPEGICAELAGLQLMLLLQPVQGFFRAMK
jgi:hypothetical protein